jgi:CarD family transcriptional regulator
MFQIGELVCYPMHGVGHVEAIEEHTVLGETSKYYLLRFIMGRMTAMVPVASADQVGLRPLADHSECEDILLFLSNDTYDAESDNWNQRYRENLDKLKAGNISDVASVVKCLKRRDEQRGLSAGERKMFLTARQVLVAELTAVTGKDEEEILSLLGN